MSFRRINCRKCWQQIPLGTRQCAHCGDTDGVRFVRGIGELTVYMACAVSAVGLAVWFAVILFSVH